MYKAQLEAQDLLDTDEAAEGGGACAGNASDAEEHDAEVIPVHGEGPALPSTGEHTTGMGGGERVPPEPIDTNVEQQDA